MSESICGADCAACPFRESCAGCVQSSGCPLPNGQAVRLLEDHDIYLGAQIPCAFDESGERCFGIVANSQFLLVSEYGVDGTDPELVFYQRR